MRESSGYRGEEGSPGAERHGAFSRGVGGLEVSRLGPRVEVVRETLWLPAKGGEFRD